MTQQNKVYSAL